MSRSSFGQLALVVGSCLTLSQATSPAQVWKIDENFRPRILRDVADIRTIARQPDGKIVVGGEFVEIAGGWRNRLARLKPDGSLDEAFDPGSGLAGGDALSLGLGADGGILVGGTFFEVNGMRCPHLARLFPDGSLDTTFNRSGGPNGAVRQLAVQPDGKVLILGEFSTVDGVPRSGFARVNAEGRLDPAFDPVASVSGSERIDFRFVDALNVQPDGKILVAGGFIRENGEIFSGLIRLSPDGVPDSAFRCHVKGGVERVLAVAVHEDGRIVIAGGFTNVSSLDRQNLARLLPDGAADAAFDSPNIGDRSVRAVAALADGSVVIGGSFTNVGAAQGGGLLKLTPGGAVDPAFAPDAGRPRIVNAIISLQQGRLLVGATPLVSVRPAGSTLERLEPSGALDSTFSFGIARSSGRVFSLVAAPDSLILLGGTFDAIDGKARAGLARLRADGSLDETFNPLPAAVNQLPSVFPLTVLPDGKTVIHAMEVPADGTRHHLIARLQKDGRLDTAFQIGEGPNGPARALAVTGDQRILVAGTFGKFNGRDANAIVRLLPDGSLDESFAPALQSNATVTAVVPTADGKLFISGVNLGPSSGGTLARLETGGAFDSTFNPPSIFSVTLSALAVPAGGGILAGGFLADQPNSRYLPTIVRLADSGGIEAALDFSRSTADRILALAASPDGGIVFSRDALSDRNLRRATVGYATVDGVLAADALDGAGLSDAVLRLLPRPDGSVVMVGLFNSIAGRPWYGVARALHGPAALLFQPKGPTPNGFEFQFQGERGRSYRIDISAELSAWAPLSTVTTTNASVMVFDPTVLPSRRFYRVVAQ